MLCLALHRTDRLNSRNSFERYRSHQEEISTRSSIVSTVTFVCLFVDFDHLSCLNTCSPDFTLHLSLLLSLTHPPKSIVSLFMYSKVGHWTYIKIISIREPALFFIPPSLSVLFVCLFVYPFFLVTWRHTALEQKLSYKIWIENVCNL